MVCLILNNILVGCPCSADHLPRQGQQEQLQQLTMVLFISKHQLYVHHAFFFSFCFQNACFTSGNYDRAVPDRFLVLWNLRGNVWDHPIGSCERWKNITSYLSICSGSFYCMPFTSLRCSWPTHWTPIVEAIWLYSLYRRFRVSSTLATQSSLFFPQTDEQRACSQASLLQTLLFTVKYRKP